VAYWA